MKSRIASALSALTALVAAGGGYLEVFNAKYALYAAALAAAISAFNAAVQGDGEVSTSGVMLGD